MNCIILEVYFSTTNWYNFGLRVLKILDAKWLVYPRRLLRFRLLFASISNGNKMADPMMRWRVPMDTVCFPKGPSVFVPWYSSIWKWLILIVIGSSTRRLASPIINNPTKAICSYGCCQAITINLNSYCPGLFKLGSFFQIVCTRRLE